MENGLTQTFIHNTFSHRKLHVKIKTNFVIYLYHSFVKLIRLTPFNGSSVSCPVCPQWTCWTSTWHRTLLSSTNWPTTNSCCPFLTSSTAWRPSTTAWSRSTRTWSTSRCVLTCLSTGCSTFTTRTYAPADLNNLWLLLVHSGHGAADFYIHAYSVNTPSAAETEPGWHENCC